MCGIAGIWQPRSTAGAPHALAQAIAAMNQRLAHRGPDGQGQWSDTTAGISLGHRRLAIQDLSDAGQQPMHSLDQRWIIVFNGEIYNFRQLRRDLIGRQRSLRGHSDTEVLVESIAAIGIADTLPRLNGMFAFAAWDRVNSELTLVRDRVGIKPLYFGVIEGRFVFASEFSAIMALPDFRLQLNRTAVAALLQFGYIPAPISIDRRIAKLLPGHQLQITLASTADRQEFPDIDSLLVRHRPKSFWEWPIPGSDRFESDTDAVSQNHDSSFWKEQFWQQFQESVQRHLVADVPIGAFLSGGIDSPLVVAAMRHLGVAPINTFTIGFQDPKLNEADTAQAISKHFNTQHQQLILDPPTMLDIVPQLPTLYGEPFADSSQIPTLLVSQLARQHVSVVLSGDGGDELFGGYQRYRDGVERWKAAAAIPKAARPPAAWLLQQAFQWTGRQRFDDYSRLIRSTDIGQFYRDWLRHWPRPEQVVLGVDDPVPGFPHTSLEGDGPPSNVPNNRADAQRWVQAMMLIDAQHYLPDDILTKVDRASMAFGLETRVPFLDHQFIEWAAGVPVAEKFTKVEGKTLLRAVLSDHLPAHLVDRPKRGFGVPLDQWLRGPLKAWASALLNRDRLQQQGIFDHVIVDRYWQQHLAGKNWQYLLWDVLMFQAWYQDIK